MTGPKPNQLGMFLRYLMGNQTRQDAFNRPAYRADINAAVTGVKRDAVGPVAQSSYMDTMLARAQAGDQEAMAFVEEVMNKINAMRGQQVYGPPRPYSDPGLGQ